MNEKEIEMLLAIDQTNSITHAAQMLFINQSSLSKRLQSLEQKLDVQLFIRSKNGVLFTPEGEAALACAKKITLLTSDLKNQLKADDNQILGTLNLGCSINYAQFKLPDILVKFQKQFPEVKLNITTDYSLTVYQKLLDDEIDVAIIRGDFTTALPHFTLAKEKIFLISQQKMSLAELKKTQFISRKSDFSFKDEMNQWLLENELLNLNNQGIIVDNVMSCVEFVKKGLGWAIVPEIALHNYDGHAEVLNFKGGRPFIRTTHLMYKKTATQLPAAASFIKLNKEENYD